jgi:hypothetical protein
MSLHEIGVRCRTATSALSELIRRPVGALPASTDTGAAWWSGNVEYPYVHPTIAMIANARIACLTAARRAGCSARLRE